MLFYLAAAAAQTVSGTVPPIDPALVKPDWTPERVTSETANFDCTIEMEDGSTSSLIIRRSGGRGYRHPVTGDVSYTPVVVTLGGGVADRFSNYLPVAHHDYIDLVERWSPSGSGTYRLNLSQTVTSYERKARSRYAIIMQTSGWPDGSRALGVGFCGASFHRQEPLSDAEARQFVRDNPVVRNQL